MGRRAKRGAVVQAQDYELVLPSFSSEILLSHPTVSFPPFHAHKRVQEGCFKDWGVIPNCYGSKPAGELIWGGCGIGLAK